MTNFTIFIIYIKAFYIHHLTVSDSFMRALHYNKIIPYWKLIFFCTLAISLII